MLARYRKDYDGEFVITQTRISNNQVFQEREWIPNMVTNTHVSPRAVCVAGYDLFNKFDFRRLKGHKGGLLASKALQTYGTGPLWKDMAFDFFVTTDPNQSREMVESGYTKDNIVFSTTKICLNNPGHFYLVPYMPNLDQLALSAYLAAFDEHSEIFLLNYSIETTGGSFNWITNVADVISSYNTVKFICVGTESATPPSWRQLPNCSILSIRDFISYCDI